MTPFITPTDLREDALDDLYEAPQVASKMLVATMGLIETLSVTQRAHLVLPLDAPERQDWDIIPRPEGTGLSLHDLSRSQKILVWDLLAAALPLRTFTQATQIPQLEHVLRDYEADFLGRAIGAWRDPNNYYVTIFGRPGFEDTFAVRFYGHHLGINLTVIKERWITAGPSAMGQQPVVYDGTNKPLADEEAAGFAIINSLADDKLSRALIHPVSRPTSPPATCRASARSSTPTSSTWACPSTGCRTRTATPRAWCGTSPPASPAASSTRPSSRTCC